jgi:FkbM family methyltransferase
MTSYFDKKFLQHLDISNVKTVFEVGARYGDETLELSKIFQNAKIYSFECNPLTIDLCKNKLSNKNNIEFISCGLGDKTDKLPFYSFIDNNDGASSLLKRIDFDKTQKQTGIIDIVKLSDIISIKKINNIDLLCMDVQGYELNVLKGAEKFIQNIKYVIMEEPKPIINTNYLPENIHSKYIDSPTSQEIKEFMIKNNFTEIERLEENMIEDNVMYKNNSSE